MSSNKVFYTKISLIEDIPNSSNIKLATIDNWKVVVGKDAKIGDAGYLCLPDAILSQEVINKYGLAYLGKSGRVRAVKLRNTVSEALFITEPDSIYPYPYSKAIEVSVGDFWNEYTPPVKRNNHGANKAKGKLSKGSLSNFPKHIDTQQYRNYKQEIDNYIADPEYTVTFSVKSHGSSGRVGYIQLPKEPNWFEQKLLTIAGWFRLYKKYKAYLDDKYEGQTEDKYSIVIGSRNVILKPETKDYYSSNLRYNSAWFASKLKPDEMVYYEILGYDGETPIMAPYKGQAYDYGIPKGEFGIQVYRITQNGIDLSVKDMYLRAKELGLACVSQIPKSQGIEQAFESSLRQVYCTVTMPTGVHRYDYKHTNEGMVIRVDHPEWNNPKFFKYKNIEFLIQEGLIPQQTDGDNE